MPGSLPELFRYDNSPSHRVQDLQQLGRVIRRAADSFLAGRVTTLAISSKTHWRTRRRGWRARAARHVGVTRVTRATRAARYPDAGPWALDAALGPFFPRLAQPSGWAFLCAAQRGHSTNAK